MALTLLVAIRVLLKFRALAIDSAYFPVAVVVSCVLVLASAVALWARGLTFVICSIARFNCPRSKLANKLLKAWLGKVVCLPRCLANVALL